MPRFLLACCLLFASAGASLAQADLDKQVADIANMPPTELVRFVDIVTATVSQDSLRMQPAAQRGDCAELFRSANSFALADRYLDAAEAALAGKPDNEAARLRSHIVQSRVLTFAARVRAEEWVGGRCASFVVPADLADDPRYVRPVQVSNADYTQAVVDARIAAENNLAVAVAAGLSNRCSEAISAAQSISLFMPYVDKLIKDVAKRPQALGPKASRRALEVTRRQLIAAAQKLDQAFGARCAVQPRPEAPAEPPASTQP